MKHSLLIIFGVLASFPIFLLCCPLSISSEERLLRMCVRRIIPEHLRFGICIDTLIFEETNENHTQQVANESKCLPCQRLCRKQQEVLRCSRSFSDGIASISNRTRSLAPFYGEIFETMLTYVCKNGSEILCALRDSKNEVFLNKWSTECGDSLLTALNFHHVQFCDLEYLEDEKLYLENLCRNITDNVECMKRDVNDIPQELASFVTGILAPIKDFPPCARFLRKDVENQM